MQYKPLHCWDCGTRVIEEIHDQYVGLPILRQVKFGLGGGSYCESPFCSSCANLIWTNERVKAFEQAVNVTKPGFPIQVVAVEEVQVLTAPIVGVVE